MSMNFKNVDEFVAAREKFFEQHPEAPEARDIKCLNLIMKRQFAEQILKGEKKLEFRAYSPHYVSRLIDREVADYIKMHINEDDVIRFCNDVRQVLTIHFHDYNNSWYLDIECTFNDVLGITPEDIKFLNEKYDCHDFDEALADFEARGEQARPFFFYFECGKVLGTNLK